MKQIIHFFGASGSGTSTLGRYTADALGLSFMDTDDYLWLPSDPPFTSSRPADERIALMRHDIDQSCGAVISGSLSGWGDVFVPEFTLAVRLVTLTDVRIARIKQREHTRFGDRILEGGDMYETHEAFVRWASKYDTGDLSMRSKASHDEWQKNIGCPIITLDGTRALSENLAKIKEAITI